MTQIIAGRFDQQTSAQHALEEILRAGFSEEQVATFYVNPPGQHDLYKIGGDREKSPGAEESETGIAKGTAAGGVVGAAVGAVTIPVLGPVGVLAGGLVGAHIGNLGGALSEMEDNGDRGPCDQPPVRQAGMMVAVSAQSPEEEDRVISVLRALEAQDIERTEGTIVDGDWQDFDPLAAPALLECKTGESRMN